MWRTAALSTIGVFVLGSAGVFAAVSGDAWPFDDRQFPATAVWALNGAVGAWLVEHGDFAAPGNPAGNDPDLEQSGLTPKELAEVQRILETDPRFKDRAFLNRGVNTAWRWSPLPPSTAPKRG
ncbi:MAG: hypothetical protein HYZ28_08190 [Myxococcales bacterium]|nr:hypothetical protein [Myxococcales bacterium]